MEVFERDAVHSGDFFLHTALLRVVRLVPWVQIAAQDTHIIGTEHSTKNKGETMSVEDLQYKASAVVIWLPEGDEPKAEHFSQGDDKALGPPYPNPCAWWELGQAVIDARTQLSGNHGKVPWIKAGERVLAPDEILKAYEYFKSRH